MATALIFHPWLVLAALMLEALISYPAWLHRRLPHPVVWIGSLIGMLERVWNRPAWPRGARRGLGVLVVLLIILIAGGAGLSPGFLPTSAAQATAIVMFGTLGLAQRSLHDHVAAVAVALDARDLAGAREAVGRIVGRDVADLDAPQVAAAAIESLAESFNDAVIAPVFWFAIAGLPGLFVYKAVNTADSMIGHREERWRHFGWAAARTDDAMNFIPARMAGLLIGVAGLGGFRTMFRDAAKHASPNSGWPEAAMAGALHVRLGGPARYDGVLTERPVFGSGAPASPVDVRRALGLFRAACLLVWGLLALGGFLWPF